jgi:hypothetical protein
MNIRSISYPAYLMTTRWLQDSSERVIKYFIHEAELVEKANGKVSITKKDTRNVIDVITEIITYRCTMKEGKQK